MSGRYGYPYVSSRHGQRRGIREKCGGFGRELSAGAHRCTGEMCIRDRICPLQSMLDAQTSPFIDFLIDDVPTIVGSGRCSVDMTQHIFAAVVNGKLESGKRYQMRAQDAFYAVTVGGGRAMQMPCLLYTSGIEVDEDATVAGHFNGGNSLPASIGVFETFFIRLDKDTGGSKGGVVSHCCCLL